MKYYSNADLKSQAFYTWYVDVNEKHIGVLAIPSKHKEDNSHPSADILKSLSPLNITNPVTMLAG